MGRPAIALCLLVLLGQVVGVVHAGSRLYIFAGSLLILDILGVALSVRAARRGDPGGGWAMVAAARAFSAISLVVLSVAGLTGDQTAWWTGTIARLLMFVLLTTALVATPARRLTGRRRAGFLADGATVLGGGFMVVWYFNINPIVDGHPAGLQWVSAIGYPIGDLLLLTTVALVLMGRVLERSINPITLYIAGLVCYLVGDVMWPAVGPHGERANEVPVAAAFLLTGSLLLTLSPMIYESPASTSRKSWEERQKQRQVHLLPLLALLVGCSLLLVVTIAENDMLPWGGLVIGLIVMAVAVAVRQVLAQRDARDLVISDPLTGLANRTGLDNAIQRAVRRRDDVALLLVDLDGFKLINDAYGHAAGDTVLVEFAHHLRSTVRTGDVAARIGGDEFAVLLTEIATTEQAGAVAQRILTAAAANPLRLGDDVVPIRASIGITVGEPHDVPKDLLRRADVAMYQAKRAGTHGWMPHDPSMTDRRAEDAALAEDVAKALQRHELTVVYQPIVDLADGHPIAVEALLRWQHPTRGPVSPVQFIPIAERSGAINEIGLWVLEQACTQLHLWHQAVPAGQPLHVSVNLSPRQLQEPTLVHDVLAILSRTGVPPQSLVLEVTESAIVDQSAIAALRSLRSHGIRIAIDDFGTGYSSLHYLTRLPVDILKIDRSFVAELNGTPEGSAITEAVIRLSQVLHLTTVAEGIETTDQAPELVLLGCETGQGYLFSRPQPPAALDAVVTAARLRS